jgi:hypothetical protein
MKILLHIGVPKTGSTAIQVHLELNRGWLSTRGVALPQTGHSEGYGHVLLFEDRTNAHLERLQSELARLEQEGVRLAVLSWEGLNTYTPEQLENVRRHLGGREVEILAYLREQSEVVQSGYLQAIKQRIQRRTLDDFNSQDRLISPPHIDYASLLERYAEVFGCGNITARVYERELLVKGNIVLDFLSIVGAEPDDHFILAPTKQNVSLDVGTAAVLNVMDSLYSNGAEREELVDLMLCHIDADGPDAKYFLEESQVCKIRAHYAASNARVMQEFVDLPPGRQYLFSPEKQTWSGAENPVELGERKFSFLSGLKDYKSWRGSALDSSSLPAIASPVSGWWSPEAEGLWSSGDTSRLRFRICPTMIPVHHGSLSLHLRGQYFADNESSLVDLPGLPEQRIDLCDAALEIPLESFDRYGRIDIRIAHDRPTTPSSLGINNDERELAYFLRSAAYQLNA